MDCQEIQGFLHTYIDQEFDEREKVEFECHLGQCGSCREEVRIYQAMRKGLRKCCPRDTASPSLKLCILDTLRTAERPERLWSPFSFGLAAATAFFFVTGALIFPSGPSKEKSAEVMQLQERKGQSEQQSFMTQRVSTEGQLEGGRGYANDFSQASLGTVHSFATRTNRRLRSACKREAVRKGWISAKMIHALGWPFYKNSFYLSSSGASLCDSNLDIKGQRCSVVRLPLRVKQLLHSAKCSPIKLPR